MHKIFDSKGKIETTEDYGVAKQLFARRLIEWSSYTIIKYTNRLVWYVDDSGVYYFVRWIGPGPSMKNKAELRKYTGPINIPSP